MEVPFQGKCRGVGARGLMLVRQARTEPESSVPSDDEHVDVWKMLDELRAERKELDDAILSLERLALGRGKRGVRPNGKNKPSENSAT